VSSLSDQMRVNRPVPDESPNEVSERLRVVLATDPTVAIAEARMALKSSRDDSMRAAVAGVLVDAGEAAGDREATKVGMTAIKGLLAKDPSNGGLRYMLGTAGLSMARHDKTPKPEWWEVTRKLQTDARRNLWEAAEAELHQAIRAQAWINLGNNLDEGGRWAEAYEAHTAAMRVDPGNPVAAGQAALLLHARGSSPGGPEWQPIAHRLARIAQSKHDQVAQIAPGAQVRYAALPTDRADEAVLPEQVHLSSYQRYVADNRLHLSMALDAMHPECWDSLDLPMLTEPMDIGSHPPPLFAMFNSCKADYLLARQLAWDGMQVDDDDQHHYTNTLDYACYGDGPSRTVLAMRSALDVLDRVAVMANSYFDIGQKPKDVYFRTAWREDSTGRPLRSVVADEIDSRNWGVLALATLAEDFRDDGWLFGRQRLRNIATHRFVISHSMMTGNWRDVSEIEHLSDVDLDASVISALRIARSALMYLVDAVARREHRRPEGASLPLCLPRLG